MTGKGQREFEKNIARLADAVEKQNAMPRRFLLGIVQGVGASLGATVIAAIVIYWLVQILQSIGLEDLLGT